MNRLFLQRPHRFWTWWLLFSAIHLLFSGGFIYCFEIQRVELMLWLSVDASEFVRTVAVYAFYCVNLPVWVAVQNDWLIGAPTSILIVGCVMTLLDSILCGAGLAGILWLAGREPDRSARRWGMTSRILGRGLIVAIIYCVISFGLQEIMWADSYGLLPSHIFWQEEIDPMLRVMHPLATLLDLDFQKDVLPYTIVMMLDSAILGVMFAWGWHWLLPTHGSPQHKASLRR